MDRGKSCWMPPPGSPNHGAAGPLATCSIVLGTSYELNGFKSVLGSNACMLYGTSRGATKKPSSWN